MKKKLSLRFVLLMLALLPMVISAIIITVYASNKMESMVLAEIETELHATTEVAGQHFNEMASSGDGSWVLDADGVLWIGNVARVDADDDFFSTAVSEDIYLTLFYGDTRYGTSIRDNSGALVIGTKASDAVISEVLRSGQNKFIEHVEIVGEDFSGYYIPMRDGSGAIVGMMFAGTPYAETEEELRAGVVSLIVILIVFMVLFGVIAVNVAFAVLKRIAEIGENVNVIAGGNFAKKIVNEHKIAELSKIADNLEGMRAKLQAALQSVIEQAQAVAQSAESTEQRIADSQSMTDNINSAVSDLAVGATSMAEDVQTTANLAVSIGESVGQVLQSANTNIEMADNVYQNSLHVQEQLEHLKEEDKETDAMAGKVQESVNETANVVEEISKAAESIMSIASQTNLLALNASIEAARAGEAGKGFAVVADNIKDLAEESNASAKEITEMLSRISALSDQNKTLTQAIKEATGTESVAFDKMSDAFVDMEHQLQDTEEGNKQIEALVESVNRDKDAIVDAVESLSSISEENAASTEETSASLTQLASNMQSVVEEAQQLKTIAESLQESVAFFKVN